IVGCLCLYGKPTMKKGRQQHRIQVATGCALYLLIHSAAALSAVTPFVSLEGSAAWTTTKDISIVEASSNTRFSIPSNLSPWGGRLAAGLRYYYREHIDFIAEAGWNYFGSASDVSTGVQGFKINTTLSGVDFLVGAVYKRKQIGWFGEVGALAQRAQYSTNSSNVLLSDIAGNLVNYTGSIKGTLLDVLPEIKVGAVYEVTHALGISLAYMHAFGGDPKLQESLTPISGNQAATLNLTVDTNNPTINSVLLGLHYSFL
ncbi:MAG: hypothetical protein U1B30_10040, partial [Pseudomonadota bacterium]|nr:hypothetical protein [Pseudomonadota bacterium]